MVEDHDLDIASISLLRAFLASICFGSVVAVISSLIIMRLWSALSWAAIYMPVSIGLEALALGLAGYLLLVGLCLAAGRGGLLKTRKGVLIYLGLFRFRISDIERVEIRQIGPFAIKSAVVHLKNGGRRHLSLALADSRLEELHKSTF